MPRGIDLQKQASNHLKLLWLKAMVMSVDEKLSNDKSRCDSGSQTKVNYSMKCRKAKDDVKTGGELPRSTRLNRDGSTFLFMTIKQWKLVMDIFSCVRELILLDFALTRNNDNNVSRRCEMKFIKNFCSVCCLIFVFSGSAGIVNAQIQNGQDMSFPASSQFRKPWSRLCPDADRDGYSSNKFVFICGPLDCNDLNRDVNPGMQEDCTDSKDNNCDGIVNEGCKIDSPIPIVPEKEPDCADKDGDGFESFTILCPTGDDCDDMDATVHPGAPEKCDDTIDNDCDQEIDAEDSECAAASVPGFTWRMHDRFGIDNDNDGIIDYYEDADGAGTYYSEQLRDAETQINPEGGFTVSFHAYLCNVRQASDIFIRCDYEFKWILDGIEKARTTTNTWVTQLPEGTYKVKLEIYPKGLSSASSSPLESYTEQVIIQDWLIVGIGDSFASGEANPDYPSSLSGIRDAMVELEKIFRQLENLGLDFHRTEGEISIISDVLERIAAAFTDVQEECLDDMFCDPACERICLGCCWSWCPEKDLWGNSMCNCEKVCGPDLLCQSQMAPQIARCSSSLSWLIAMLPPLISEAPGAVIMFLNDLLDPLTISVQGIITDILADGDVFGAILDEIDRILVTIQTITSNFDRIMEISSEMALNDSLINNLEAEWQDQRCHRSGYSAQALAAWSIERRDPRTSVTFIHLACSGGTIEEGLIGPYSGAEYGPTPIRAQVDKALELVGDREVDAVLVSVGGNDVGFAPQIIRCITQEPCFAEDVDDLYINMLESLGATDILRAMGLLGFCNTLEFLDDTILNVRSGEVEPLSSLCNGIVDEFSEISPETAATSFDDLKQDLPLKYERLSRRLGEFPGVAGTTARSSTDQRIYITKYPNLTMDENGDYCDGTTDVADPLNSMPGISQQEFEWAYETLTSDLNEMVEQASDEHGWRLVGGFGSEYETDELGIGYLTQNHGICTANNQSWFRRVPDTFLMQKNHNGMIHPTITANRNIANAILDKLVEDFYEDGDLQQPPRPPVESSPQVFPTTETDCDNQQDEDNDGLTDCADPDCLGVSCGEWMSCSEQGNCVDETPDCSHLDGICVEGSWESDSRRCTEQSKAAGMACGKNRECDGVGNCVNTGDKNEAEDSAIYALNVLADNVKTIADNSIEAVGAPDGGYIALGAGYIVAEMEDWFGNGPGEDLRIYEVGLPEPFDVYISADAGKWTTVAEGISKQSSDNLYVGFDIALIRSIMNGPYKYVKIVGKGENTNNTSGADIDAIAALYPADGESDDIPVATAEPEITVSDFYGVGTYDYLTQKYGVNILWTTTKEKNISGFNLYRTASTKVKPLKINTSVINAAGAGQYLYPDIGLLRATTYVYKLKAIDANGDETDVGSMNATSGKGLVILPGG